MTYEIIYKKTSEHSINIEADSIHEAYDAFHAFSKSDLDERENGFVPHRKVTSVSEEELLT